MVSETHVPDSGARKAKATRYTRTTVGAHYGTRDWLLQRLTAVLMALYTLLLAGCILAMPPRSYADWKTLFTGTPFRVATLLFFAALLYHAWVGMRDIVMDYVKSAGVRLVLQSAIGATLLLYLLWAATILWR